MTEPKPPVPEPNEFLTEARGKERGIVAEFVAFMKENKAWWMTPILVVLGLVSALLILGATPIGHFIYTFL